MGSPVVPIAGNGRTLLGGAVQFGRRCTKCGAQVRHDYSNLLEFHAASNVIHDFEAQHQHIEELEHA